VQHRNDDLSRSRVGELLIDGVVSPERLAAEEQCERE
jgi:hypothetical protein